MSPRLDSGNIEDRVTMILGGRVAQLAEHLDHNQGVTGSSPVPPTIKIIEPMGMPQRHPRFVDTVAACRCMVPGAA